MEENIQSKSSEVTEKLTLSLQNDLDQKVDKSECVENIDSFLESSPSVSVHSSPAYKPHTESSAGIIQSPPNDDATTSSPSEYRRNVRHRESKGKGRENKGNFKTLCV